MDPALLVLLLVMMACLVTAAVGISGHRRRELASRQDRWRALEQRFDQVTMDSVRSASDPRRALDAPGWVDESHPMTRAFQKSLSRAQKDRLELERSVAPAPGPGVVARISGEKPRDHAATLAPTEQELQRFEQVVEHAEDTFGETQQALTAVGWSGSGAVQAPHAQFLLDHRWGRPAIIPSVHATDPARSVGAVRTFISEIYPVRLGTAQSALRERVSVNGSPRRELRSLEMLVASGRLRVDQEGFIWPGSVRVEHWGVFRTFGKDADLQLDDVPAVEVANALWAALPAGEAMDEAELTGRAKELLGLAPGTLPGLREQLNASINRGVESLPETMRSIIHDVVPNGTFIPSKDARHARHLEAGLIQGLRSGRLRRTPDGRIVRGRAGWPGSYR